MKPTRFETEDLSRARFEVEPDQHVWFEEISVRGVDFSGLRFGTKDADGGIHAHSCLFEDCDFSDVTFAVADLGWGGRTVYRRCTFDRAELHQVHAMNSQRMMAFRLSEARFEDCTFLDAKIRGWLAHEADFVGCRFLGTIDRCRFFGRAPDRRWFRIKRNEYRGNDFRDVEFIWSSFEAGIPIEDQLWPSSPEYIRLDRITERVAWAEREISVWSDDDRRQAENMLAGLQEDDQEEIFQRRIEPDTAPEEAEVQRRVWALLESRPP
jgi:uncharacterized protein YjbI with pentapeptide repeats